MPALGPSLAPCGPLLAEPGLGRVRERLGEAAGVGEAWAALAPVFAASPYLAELAAADPARLSRVLGADPDDRFAAILADTRTVAEEADAAVAGERLRRLKGELHLLTALADLGGVWGLERVTAALSDFADAAVQTALAVAVTGEHARGRLLQPDAPGLFVLALGKHGAGELNYSSDIDISVFFDPAALPAKAEPERTALRITQAMARLLSERTAAGYVFRVDLRLRPDPSSTPAAVPVEMALRYYESVGQNWERAALIKARVCAGDPAAGAAFLGALQSFIWRRALDYAAIADIHAIKRQIHAHRELEREGFAAAGADLKLGPGGIREIEFYAQTQQLILGGRHPDLRAPRTVDALHALAAAGHMAREAADELEADYARLRGWEHRVQMVHDAQTHTLPQDDAARTRVAALSGLPLSDFDLAVCEALTRVNRRYGELFADEEPLSSPYGSLVFTGVDDDPETLRTLAAMGFAAPEAVAATIRAWHHGRIAPTRTERGRALFTRLAPRVLDACAATGAPDAAFARFTAFFSGLASGVQVQSLLLAEPRFLDLVIDVLTLAPRLATVLARYPSALDALLDPGFFAPLAPGDAQGVGAAAQAAGGFEAAMDAVRRAHRDEAFRIGVHVVTGRADATGAGAAFADLADACVRALAVAARAEVARIGGAWPGELAVVGLGKLGGREMTAGSDLDLMTVYRAAPGAASAIKGWASEAVAARFTQRLTAALSAPTAEGPLYAVDLQLRPSGTAGPVAVSLAALEGYYAGEAQTWEFLALTRARVVWASSQAFGEAVAAAIDAALRRPRDPAAAASDVREMRALMARERPPNGPWDLKLLPGGLVDIEFAAQHLQLTRGVFGTNTGEALHRLAGAADAADLAALEAGWSLQQALSQVLKLALSDGAEPAAEPARLQALLARAGGCHTLAGLRDKLTAAQTAAHAAFERVTR